MDANLKERLIGAAVLVAIGVWVIPWVLGGRPHGETETEALPLALPPAADSAAPVRRQVIDLDQQTPPAIPAPKAASTIAEADARERGSAVAKQSEATPEPVASAPKPVAASPATPAPAATSAAAPAPAAASASGEWTVQLGSFGEADNAERLAERVGVLGFKADVSSYRSDGKLMHRVRVGPQPSRDRAEAVASALGAHGFVAQVVPAT